MKEKKILDGNDDNIIFLKEQLNEVKDEIKSLFPDFCSSNYEELV